MDTSLANPVSHQRQTFLSPLAWLSPFAKVAIIVGLIAAFGALVAVAIGGRGWAMVLGAAACAVLLLATASVWVSKRQTKPFGRNSKLVSTLLSRDPDPVFVTNNEGVPLMTNAAVGAVTTLQARLADWCVNPAQTIATMLDEVHESGFSEREFRRKNKSLKLVSHISDDAGEAIVWRFSMQHSEVLRVVEMLGIPVLTQDNGVVLANSAARAIADHETCTAIAQDTALSFGEDHQTGQVGGATVTLPSGQVMHAVRSAAHDGLEDVVLVPPMVPPRDFRSAQASDFEDIPVALLQLDAEGRIAGTNRLARSLLALEEQDTRFFWQVVEGLGRPVADWLDDARAGRALGRPEVLRASMTGTETYVQIILRRIGSGGTQDGLVAVISDATELKSLEARFVQSQKMQAIGQLAGGIAHDFNNLLTAISGHCDLLLVNRDRFDPDYNDLLQIHQNSNRAAALVRQLLAFSRKQTMKPETLRLESLLEELTHLLTRLVGERIALDLSHDPALTAIRADRRQLEQVIMNLVVNARDAMPMGGTIRIETEAKHVDVELELGRVRLSPGDYAVVRVIDQGVGIPATIIDKIFEPFFTTKRLGEGTGLGLSTAYGIVKQMGGYIFAESVEGSGTVFTLYFASLSPEALAAEARSAPRRAPATSPRTADVPSDALDAAEPVADLNPNSLAAPAAAPVAQPRSGTILLVEDEAPVRAFAARALRLRGYQVFEAQDGEQALEFLEDNAVDIDLFVTDVIMPGIDGPGWVTQALVHRPGTPVVFVSGYTEDTLSEALSRIPRSIFLGKPFSLQDLSTAIDDQLAS